MRPALLCGVWGPGPLICGDVLWREPPSVITLLPIAAAAAAAATEPPASAGPYSSPLACSSPRGPDAGNSPPRPPTVLSRQTTSRPPRFLTPRRPQAGWGGEVPAGRGLSPGQGPERIFLVRTNPPPLSLPGNLTQTRALGTRLPLRNIWTGVAPVQTRSQLGLELPATLIPGRKHSTLASSSFPHSTLFPFLNHLFTYLL